MMRHALRLVLFLALAGILAGGCGGRKFALVNYAGPRVSAAVVVSDLGVTKDRRRGRLSVSFQIGPAGVAGSSRPLDARLSVVVVGGNGGVVKRVDLGSVRHAWPRFKTDWSLKEAEARLLAGSTVSVRIDLEVGRAVVEQTARVRLEVAL